MATFCQASYSPTSLHHVSNRSEAYGSLQGSQSSPVPTRLAYQGPITRRGTTENKDHNGPTIMDPQSREVRTKTHSGVFSPGL